MLQQTAFCEAEQLQKELKHLQKARQANCRQSFETLHVLFWFFFYEHITKARHALNRRRNTSKPVRPREISKITGSIVPTKHMQCQEKFHIEKLAQPPNRTTASTYCFRRHIPASTAHYRSNGRVPQCIYRPHRKNCTITF